jgi:hypothetical protein
VVQISKIQVRRGQKNSNSGIPQLSSAEFAWAVDSQELFIGNGSVLEGAPYVGNTKVLTEHDNILELASSYQFANDDTAITLSVSRSLQSKEDETVSVADFGAVGDGSTDCVAAFETAFTELFRNANENYKKELLIPNGEYLFTTDLAVPSGVILKGETQLGAVLNIGGNNIRLITSQGLELGDFNSTNRPQNMRWSNFTIKRTTGTLTLSGLAESRFESLRFLGEYNLGNAVDVDSAPAAIFWQNTGVGTRAHNLVFNECVFEQNAVSAKCLQEPDPDPTAQPFETVIRFQDCKFFVNDTAIYIDGVTAQGNHWQINDCEFEEVANQAFRSTAGRGTLIQRSKFKAVGTGTSISTSPNDYMVYFGEKIGNVLVDCTSDRQQAAGTLPTVTSGTAAFSEVYNASGVSFVNKNYAPVPLSDSFAPLAAFSAQNKFTVINYCLKLGEHTRYGTATIVIGDDLSPESHGSDVSITDSFAYSPNTLISPGGSTMTNFEFSVAKSSNTVLDDSTAAVIDTVMLTYKNPLATGIAGSISYDVAYGV